MNRYSGHLLIVLTIILGGCAFFVPDYQKPKIDTPSGWQFAESHINNVESLPYLAWWQQFNDPVLDHLIQQGLINNNNIQIARSNLSYSKSQLKQVQLNWIPGFNLLGGFTQNPALGNIGTFYGIWPQYFVNIPSLISQQAQAKYLYLASKANQDAVRLTVIGQIAASYFTYLAQLEQLRLTTELSHDLEHLIQIQKRSIHVGINNEFDLNQLETEHGQVVAELNIIHYNLVVSQNSLRYLLNQNPGLISSGAKFRELDVDLPAPGQLPATVLQNRPDLISAELQLMAANEGISITSSKLLPSINLDSFLGNMSGNGTVASPNEGFIMNEAYLNWGVSASTFAAIAGSKDAYKASTYKYIETVRDILRDVDNDFAAHKFYTAQYHEQQKALAALTKNFNLQQNLTNQGISSVATLLMAKVKVDSLALSVNQSKLQQLMSLVMLYQDLAGGYKANNDESDVAKVIK